MRVYQVKYHEAAGYYSEFSLIFFEF